MGRRTGWSKVRRNVRCPQQARERPLYLDEGQALKLKPDLSWWHDGRCLFVGDAKYKMTPEVARVKHPDAYQLLAYTTATKLSQGLVIYAAGEEVQRTYAVPLAGKRLEVRTLDLDQSPEDVLAQIEEVAARVRVHAQIAVEAESGGLGGLGQSDNKERVMGAAG